MGGHEIPNCRSPTQPKKGKFQLWVDASLASQNVTVYIRRVDISSMSHTHNTLNIGLVRMCATNPYAQDLSCLGFSSVLPDLRLVHYLGL